MANKMRKKESVWLYTISFLLHDYLANKIHTQMSFWWDFYKLVETLLPHNAITDQSELSIPDILLITLDSFL